MPKVKICKTLEKYPQRAKQMEVFKSLLPKFPEAPHLQDFMAIKLWSEFAPVIPPPDQEVGDFDEASSAQ